jgi:hypothetical protein
VMRIPLRRTRAGWPDDIMNPSSFALLVPLKARQQTRPNP